MTFKVTFEIISNFSSGDAMVYVNGNSESSLTFPRRSVLLLVCLQI